MSAPRYQRFFVDAVQSLKANLSAISQASGIATEPSEVYTDFDAESGELVFFYRMSKNSPWRELRRASQLEAATWM